MKGTTVDEVKAIEFYEKYGSMNRAALSAGCSPKYLKKILLKHNIEIKKPPLCRIDMKRKNGQWSS